MIHALGSITVFLTMVIVATLIYLDTKGRITFSDKGFVWAVVCLVTLVVILF
ncbi:MAG: hypothetical protein ACM3TR_09645 [Caulobacteraceae bacterium]